MGIRRRWTALARRVETGGRFVPSLARARVLGGSAAAKAVSATLRDFANATTLPSPRDYKIALPPVRTAWCRRVTAQNLGLVYDLRNDVVYALMVLSSPPIPLD